VSIPSALRSLWEARAFARVRYFCLFVGPPRNGSSILGGLLDAHPDMVISHELDVLGSLHLRTRNDLFHAIVHNAHVLAGRGRWQQDQSHAVPGAWQGRFRTIRVIGDKKADWTALHFLNDPGRLSELRAILRRNLYPRQPVRIKFIQTVRNPYDNIATIRRRRPPGQTYTIRSGEGEMENGIIGFYFDRVLNAVTQLQARWPAEDWIIVHHEDLVSDPGGVLTRLCAFLEVEAPEDYLRACATVVHKAPHPSRHDVTWQPEEIAEVERRSQAFEFLRRYRFDS
jgi:hypothetical protein